MALLPPKKVVERSNAKAALKRVKQNKGSPGSDGMTVEARRRGPRARNPVPAGTHHAPLFLSARVFSDLLPYMWSLVIAKDLFEVFRGDGLLHSETPRRCRRTILEPGGSRPAVKLVLSFLGHPSVV